jgi:TRAP-type C4-dicarboxylate transport system permease small subunit
MVMMVRTAMDALYRVSEALAAGVIFVIFAVILVQVGFGLADRMAEVLNRPAPGHSIPSYAEISGYLLAAAAFLGLAGALRAHAHVRVTLVLQSVPAGPRRAMEVASGILGVAASGYFAWRTVLMVHDSWTFGDVSYGMIAFPMWLAQAPMALGLVVLTLAFVDTTLMAASGKGLPPDQPIEGRPQGE